MVKGKSVINNPTGLHLRPAGIFCQTAMEFKSKITFVNQNGVWNAKSILSVLGSCIRYGDEIELICDGIDEVEALAAMLKAISEGLGE